MKKYLELSAHMSLMLSVVVSFSSAVALADAKVDPALKKFADGKSKNEKARVIAVLEYDAKQTESPRRYEHDSVVAFLKSVARDRAAVVVQSVKSSGAGLDQVQIRKVYWVNNSMTVDVDPRGLRLLAAAPGVKKIYLNRMIYREPSRESPGFSPKAPGSKNTNIPYDFVEMGLDQLIKEAPQVTGQGVLIGHIDTGVDGAHPALKGKVAKFYDSSKRVLSEPFDADTHGTHTAGTLVGGNRTDNFIGVAPDARLVASGPISNYDDMLGAMEFMLDPDRNPQTKDFPRLVSNSWNCEGAPDTELFYRAIAAWEAAGILPVFSAGNSGPRASSITRPHEYPGVLAVGSTGPDRKIADYSSRGPGIFRGQPIQKPDLTAPGSEINSTIPGGGYEKMDGTSMAAPHAGGAVALILQVNPELNPAQVRELLVHTATPTSEDGSPGTAGVWNASYGFGKISVYKAARMARKLAQAFSDALSGQAYSFLDIFLAPERIAANAVISAGQLEPEDSVLAALNYPVEQEGNAWIKIKPLKR